MKEFACGDVVPGCGATFRVLGEEQMLQLCTVHAQNDHGLSEPQMPDELIERIRAAMQDAA